MAMGKGKKARKSAHHISLWQCHELISYVLSFAWVSLQKGFLHFFLYLSAALFSPWTYFFSWQHIECVIAGCLGTSLRMDENAFRNVLNIKLFFEFRFSPKLFHLWLIRFLEIAIVAKIFDAVLLTLTEFDRDLIQNIMKLFADVFLSKDFLQPYS